MKYQEIRHEGIPSLSFMRDTDYILYVGPKLSRFQRRRLDSCREDAQIIYLPDIISLLSKEVFEYNLPGVQWSEKLSAKLIYDRIRTELGGQFTSRNRLLIRFEEDELVIYDAGWWFYKVVSYLKNAELTVVLSNEMLSFEEDSRLLFRTGNADDVDDEVVDFKYKEEEEEVEVSQDDGIRFSVVGKKDPQSGADPAGSSYPMSDDYYRSMLSSVMGVQPQSQPAAKKKIKRTVTKYEADATFNEQMISAARQVHMYIKDLLLQGFPAELLQIWIDENVRLSRLRITRQYKVILVDYDREVTMGPLPMTVFLFFLRHPEGVRLSYLQDHVDELRMIYGHVSVNDDPQKMEASIAALVDPFNNSICEKCAAVKKAFMRAVNDSIARNYYITGEQGKKKGILLDRNLVEWECEL